MLGLTIRIFARLGTSVFSPDGTGHTDGVFDGTAWSGYPNVPTNITNSVSFGTAALNANAPAVPVPFWAMPLVAGLLFGAARFAGRG